MGKRVLLVGNPTAQSGRAKKRIEQAAKALTARGFSVETLHTAPQGRTVGLVQETLDQGDAEVVIYLGGDGTFAEVAKGNLRAQQPRPMGMLPSGTANDQGKSFGVRASPSALQENIDVIEAGHITHLDVGRIRMLPKEGEAQEALFFDSAGFGFTPEVLQQRNKDRKLVEKIPLLRDVYRDHAVYAGALLNRYLTSFVEPHRFTASLLADGTPRRYEGLTDLVVNATAIYGGAWVLARESEPDDGYFEVIPMQGRRDFFSKILRDLEAIPIWQEHLDVIGLEHARGFRFRQLELTLEHERGGDLTTQIDGEEWVAGQHFTVEVLPRLLPLITPGDFVPPWRPVA